MAPSAERRSAAASDQIPRGMGQSEAEESSGFLRAVQQMQKHGSEEISRRYHASTRRRKELGHCSSRFCGPTLGELCYPGSADSTRVCDGCRLRLGFFSSSYLCSCARTIVHGTTTDEGHEVTHKILQCRLLGPLTMRGNLNLLRPSISCNT